MGVPAQCRPNIDFSAMKGVAAGFVVSLLLSVYTASGCKPGGDKITNPTPTSDPPTQTKVRITCGADGSCLNDYKSSGNIDIELRGSDDRRGILHHDLRVNNQSIKCYQQIFKFLGMDKQDKTNWIPNEEEQKAYDIVPNYSELNLCQAIVVFAGIKFKLCPNEDILGYDASLCSLRSHKDGDCLKFPDLASSSPIIPVHTWLMHKKQEDSDYPKTTMTSTQLVIDWGDAKGFNCRKTNKTKGTVDVRILFLPKESGQKEQPLDLPRQEYNYFENMKTNLTSKTLQCKNYKIEITLTMKINQNIGKWDVNNKRVEMRKHSIKFVKARPPLQLVFPPKMENNSVLFELMGGMNNCSTLVYKAKCDRWKFGDVVVPIGKEDIYKAKNSERSVWIPDLQHKVCRIMAYFEGYPEEEWSQEFSIGSPVDPVQVTLIVFVVVLSMVITCLGLTLVKCFYSRKSLKEERDEMKAKEDRLRRQQKEIEKSEDNESDDYSDEEKSGQYPENRTRKMTQLTEVMYEDPDEVDSSSDEEYPEENLKVPPKNKHKMRKMRKDNHLDY